MARTKIDLSNPMNQFQSKPRKFGSIVTEREQQAKRDASEWSEQLRFCKWLKHEYPDVLFRSDEQNQGKRSPGMQNILNIIDPYRSGMPDIIILHPVGKYCGLMIEMKAIGASVNTEHGQNQGAMHRRLGALGWRCSFAWGEEDAKRVWLEYIGTKKYTPM